ncbi:DUF4440 domain-containing protein [Candidatus Uhrbacteria bacterium]|nr:DUF4440 domain-containing protein [Candidatus Uhrbacteria bacterium]
MNLSNDDLLLLEKLEESMWKPETRFDQEYMRATLHPDFFEFGRSGRVYAREETLSAPMQEIPAVFPLKNFRIAQVAPEVVLITYISEVNYPEPEVGNRSSIWVHTEGTWKLRFHQGTPTQS